MRMHTRDGTIDKVLMEIPYSQLKKFIGMTRIKNENVSTKLGQTLENDISGNGVIQRIPPPPLLLRHEEFAKRGSRGKSYHCKIMKITKITERFLCLKMIQMIPI